MSQPIELGRLYTADEFVALPEDTSLRYELQEGILQVSPRPSQSHMIAIAELGDQLRAQVPGHLRAMPEIDVILVEVADTVRCPDLVVMRRSALRRVGGARSDAILLVVEIVSPGSARVDTKIKIMEYADAGIPHCWVIDPEPPVTATVYHLVNGCYEESLSAQGVFEVNEPCPLRIDLDELTDEELS